MSVAGPYIDSACAHAFDALLHFREDARLEEQRRNTAGNLDPDLAAGQQLFKPLEVGRAVHPHEGIDDHLIASCRITIHHVKQRGKLGIIGQQRGHRAIRTIMIVHIVRQPQRARRQRIVKQVSHFLDFRRRRGAIPGFHTHRR